jgi:PGF-CTERM protein
MVEWSYMKYVRSKAGVVVAVLLIIVSGAALPITASAQSNPVQESEVDMDGSKITVDTGGSDTTKIENLPTNVTISNVSDSGAYNDRNKSILYSTSNSSLPAKVTFTLNPADSAYTAGSDLIKFSVDDTSVSLDVVDEGSNTTREGTNFTVEIVSTTSPVNAGDNLTVETNIENNGGAKGTQSVVLKSPAGTEIGNSSITLAAGASTTSTFTWKTDADDATKGNISIISGDNQVSETVTIKQQARPNLSVSLSIPDKTIPNSSLEVSGTVENTGSGQASDGATLVFDGETVDSVPTIEVGENLTLVGSVEAGKVGESYNVTISAGNVSKTTTVTVTDPTSVDLSLYIDAPVTVDPATSFEVTGTVENTENVDISGGATLAVDNETADSVAALGSGEQTVLTATATAGEAGSTHKITLSAVGLSTTKTVKVTESGAEECTGNPVMSQTSITTTDETITANSPARIEANFGVDQNVPQQCSVMVDIKHSFSESGFRFSGGSDWEQSDANNIATQFEGIKAGEKRSISAAVTATEADPGDKATVVTTYEMWYKGNRGDAIQQTARETVTVEDGSTDDGDPQPDPVKVPGFGIPVSLTALLSGGYLLRRRLNEPEE